MKICLIAPKNPESFWTFDRILPTLGKRCLYPNLSLPTVAGLTPPGHEIVLVDENVEAIDFDIEADVFGLTGYVVHRQRLLEIAAELRRRGKFVVVGGPYASLCPEELREHVDVVFVDEAEYTWPQFVADYAAGTWQREYRQVEKPSLEDSPLPRFDLLKHQLYRSMTIQFARGCPFNCEFCDIIVMYGRRPRTKSVPQVLAEIEAIHGLGMSNIFVVDDNFIGDKRRAKHLLEAIVAWQRQRNFPIELMTEVTLNVAQDDELLQLLRQAGFTTVFIGIESPRVASLQETHKTQNLRQGLLESVHHIQAAGIEVMAGMIVGFDHDDAGIFAEQQAFIEAARIPISMTGMLNAVPKTPLHARLKEAGRLAADIVGDQFVFSNILPAGMSRHELFAGYKRLLEDLYGYGAFRRRAKELLLARGDRSVRPLAVRREDVVVFARILRDCVLRASPRRAWMTLSLLLEILVRRPSAFRDAVSLALLHKHLYEYMRHLGSQLDRMLLELAEVPPATQRALS